MKKKCPFHYVQSALTLALCDKECAARGIDGGCLLLGSMASLISSIYSISSMNRKTVNFPESAEPPEIK